MSQKGNVAIAQLAAILKQLPDRHFTIAGHSDAVPVDKSSKFKGNWELSTARAVAVLQLLVEMGISPERLVAAGYAEFDPVASNKTEAGRLRNRRIEIILEPNLKPVLASKDKEGPKSGP